MDALVRKVLGEIGINPERFSLQWASAAEAPRFVKLITEFTARIKALGPLGQAEGIAPAELKKRLEKAMAVVSDRKVRMAFGTTTKAIRKDGVFTREAIMGAIENKLSKSVTEAFSTDKETGKPAPEEKEGKPSTALSAAVNPVEESAPAKDRATGKGQSEKKSTRKKGR
ncbi:MAG: hypothetical protein A2521_15745 [Deltaproteobacteria bacterium RIFOXYD12_FULL_57_12]|nr:MAG: hypothetical protein A2521_15745 [Deltaproteobacteria bacterium RIFOXYD12_FULL_57_12]